MRWAQYLENFHGTAPGITEAVLVRSLFDTEDPYDWLIEQVPGAGRVVDVACGSGPLWPGLAHRTYLGVDASGAELCVARERGAPVTRASALNLPLADRSVQHVTCSMALQVLPDLPRALAEIGRVLEVGGRLVATVPASGPLRLRDAIPVGLLLCALGRRLGYPNDEELQWLPELLTAAGFRLVSDDRRRFDYRLGTDADADRLLASLYLPDLRRGRSDTARRVLRTLARIPAMSFPVPIRRVVAVRA